jgi:hypothetical protein
MDVSHFELVFKPQSPVPPADTVLQGYFLKITNLEAVEFRYQLEFVTSPVADPDRDLFNNTVVFVDTPGTNNNIGAFTLIGGPGSGSYRLNRFVSIPPLGTALVALLPSDPFTGAGQPPNQPDFECRGFVRLTLPAVSRNLAFGIRFPQSASPVKVMLTPQHRATYLSGGQIKDQTQSSIPTATGGAVNLVPPEPGLVIAFPDITLDLSKFERLVGIEPPSVDLLAGLLAEAAENPGSFDGFNKALARAGIGIALERRKVDRPAAAPARAMAEQA